MPGNFSKYCIPGYRVMSQIGAGNSGTVFKVEETSSDSSTESHVTSAGRGGMWPSPSFAAKVIPARKVTDSVRREVELHLRLSEQSSPHRNIVALRRVALAQDVEAGMPALALIMDHASAADMFVEVASAGGLPASVVRRRLSDIASALSFLHRRNVVHLDVKLENIVVDNSSVAKLTDFGCARTLPKQTKPENNRSDDAKSNSADDLSLNWKEDEHVEYSLGGTLYYLSPEAINDRFGLPTPAMDAWALGVLIYTALVGNYPFAATPEDHDAYCKARENVDSSNQKNDDDENDDDDDLFVRNRILNEDPHAIPSYISVPSDLHRIIFGLLDKNPLTRMTVDQVVEILRQTASARTSRTSRYAHLLSTHARRQYRSPLINPLNQPCDAIPVRSPSPSSPMDADFSSNSSPSKDLVHDKAEEYRRLARVQSALAVVDSVVNASRTPSCSPKNCHSQNKISRVNSCLSNGLYPSLSSLSNEA